MDRTVWGRQEPWEDSPAGWPQGYDESRMRVGGRPASRWSRLAAGRSDRLEPAPRDNPADGQGG